MARHVWTVICSEAIIDQASQNLTLVKVIEEVQVTAVVPKGVELPSVTAFPFSVAIVSLWERSSLDVPEERESSLIKIMSPTGNELARNEQVFSLIGAQARSRNIVNVQGFPATEAGRYEVLIFEKRGKQWKEVAKLPLTVTVSVTEKPEGKPS